MGIDKLNISELKPIVPQQDYAKLDAKLDPKDIKIDLVPIQIDPEQISKDTLKQVLQKYGQDSSRSSRQNIDSLSFDEQNKTLILQYKDNKVKKVIKEDLSYQTITTSKNEETGEDETITSSYTSESRLISEKLSKLNYSLETFFDENQHKIKTIENDNNKCSTTTILFDEAETPLSKEVKQGSTICNYDYKGKDNTERIVQKTTDSGLPIEKTEKYTYLENGDVEIRTYSASMQAASSQSNNDDDDELKSASQNPDLSSEVKTNQAEQANDGTVKYCSSSNFDCATGNVKDPTQLQDSPINNQNNATQKTQSTNNNGENASQNQQSSVENNEDVGNNSSSSNSSSNDSSTTSNSAQYQPQQEVKQVSSQQPNQPNQPNQSNQPNQPNAKQNAQASKPANSTQPNQSTALPTGQSQKQTTNNTNQQQPTTTAVPNNAQQQTTNTAAAPNNAQQLPQAQPVSNQSTNSRNGSNTTTVPKRATGGQTQIANDDVNAVRSNNQSSETSNIIKNKTEVKTSDEEHSDSIVLKNKINDVSQHLNNYIKQYAKELNISENKVKELLGLPSDIDTDAALTKINNESSLTEQKIKNIENAISNLKSALQQNGIKDINKIKIAIDNLIKEQINIEANNRDEKTNSATQQIVDNGFIEVSEPEEIADIPKVSQKSGINATELSTKLQSLKEGQSFVIKGRTNINGEISNKLYKVENKNGKILITEIKVTHQNQVKNDTIPQETIDEFISILPADLKQKMANFRTIEEFKETFEEIQNNVSTKVTQPITKQDLATTKNKNTTIVFRNGTFFRVPLNHKLVTQQNAVDAIVLNVEADKRFLEELDEVISTGKYTDSQGKQIKIRPQNATLATTSIVEEWQNKEDPAVVYFDKKIEPEMEEAIIEISRKYARKVSSETQLSASADKNPAVIQENADKEKRIQEIIAKMGLQNPPQLREFIFSMITTTDFYRKYNRNMDEDSRNTREVSNDEIEGI